MCIVIKQGLSGLDRLTFASRLIILLMIGAAGCGPEEPMSRIIRSPVVPFAELFSVADTVRLDSSVLVGNVGFLDVNTQGEFLVSDHVGRGVHRFSPSGSHVHSYSASDCLPDEGNFMPMSSRFLEDGRIMTMQFGAGVAVFDTNGSCVAATRQLEPRTSGFCVHQGSIVVQSIYVGGQASMGVYSPALESLDDLEIESPRLVGLNQFSPGLMGTRVACFTDGPYYVYGESMDGIAARPGASTIQYQPEFFEYRLDDLPKGADFSVLREHQDEYPTVISLFALDGSTRMIVTAGLADKWHLDSPGSLLGLSMASNTGRFPGRSTVSPVTPQAAGNGYFYAVGSNEPLPNGDVGNPVIVRYRFIPPKSTDE